MVIDSASAQRFIDTYMAFLATLVSDEGLANRCTIEWLALGRTRYAEVRDVLMRYRAANGNAVECTGWRWMRKCWMRLPSNGLNDQGCKHCALPY